MNDLDLAFEKHMEYIVKEEKRPFCGRDFINFTHDGRNYSVRNGTYRNKISQLKAKNKVILAYRTTLAYYSLPGYDFKNPMAVTTDHAGLPIKTNKEMKLYKWVKERTREKQSLHDIRLTFSARGIWKIISKSFPDCVNLSNKDVKLDSWKLFDDIEVKCTIHHSDTVSIAIACSSRPIVIDFPDVLYLVEILTRTEIMIQNLCYSTPSDNSITIPRYTTWIAKMWHFGRDSLDRYDGEAFHITFEEGMGDLWRIYTKRSKDNKLVPRTEHQEYPDKPAIEAIFEKIFSEGIRK